MNAQQAAALADQNAAQVAEKKRQFELQMEQEAAKKLALEQAEKDIAFERRYADIQSSIEYAVTNEAAKQCRCKVGYQDEEDRIMAALRAEGYEVIVANHGWMQEDFDYEGASQGEHWRTERCYYISWEPPAPPPPPEFKEAASGI
jgi:uncharacterized protein YutD